MSMFGKPVLAYLIRLFNLLSERFPNQPPRSRTADSQRDARKAQNRNVDCCRTGRVRPHGPLPDANFAPNSETVRASERSAREKTDPHFRSDI